MFWEIVGGLFLLFAVYVWSALAPPDKRKQSGGDWDQYIGQADAAKVAAIKAKEASEAVGDEEYIKTYNTPGKQLLILYGSEYGFAEQVAKKLFLRLIAAVNTAAGVAPAKSSDDDEKAASVKPLTGTDALCQVRLVNMRDTFEYVDLSKEQAVLVICSTTGDGVPPSEARKFVDELCESKEDLSHLRVSVLALGDSGYPHFCRTGKTVDRRFTELRAKSLVPRVDVDLEDWGTIDSWFERCIAKLPELSDSKEWTVRDDYLSRLAPPKPPKRDGFDRNRPFMSVVTTRHNLTKSAADSKSKEQDKETIHIEFDLADSKLEYTPGDALGLCPLNNPPEVAAVLRALGLGDGARRVASPIKKRANDTEYDPMPAVSTLLSSYYDLKKIKPELVQTLASFIPASATEQKRVVTALLAGGLSKQNVALHEYLKDRELIDVLETCSSAIGGATGSGGGSAHGASGGIPLDRVLENLRALQPRYYSIASCPQTNAGKVQLCVAIVRYTTHGRARTGTATTYMQDRIRVGDRMPIFMSVNHEFRLPADPTRPIIMIGPGTGLAPFRAFIQHRLLTNATGKNLLYFGCRSRNADYLYGDQLEGWSSKGAIQLRTAFSRDQAAKIYVQHLIAADAKLIWDLLQQNAHVYVCGDGANMAADVNKALQQIVIANGAAANTDAAERYLEQLTKAKRYQRDVWVT